MQMLMLMLSKWADEQMRGWSDEVILMLMHAACADAGAEADADTVSDAAYEQMSSWEDVQISR